MKNREDVKSGAAAGGRAPGCETNSDGPPLRPRPPARERRLPDGSVRKLEGPVAWLLGAQLIRSVKGILLYSAYGKKLDPRDWMTAKLASLDPEDPRELADGVDRAQLAARLERQGGFWFDYISDTGDGEFATYSIAYLCQSDLAVPTVEPGALRAGTPAAPAHVEPGAAVLPRGEFLFVGGDTAYHASDYMTLIDRIYNTFNLAHEDLLRDGGLKETDEPRPIYGVPGNHDYYDQLDGFRRQFRHPALWERRPAAYRGGAEAEPPDSDDDYAQLSLRGFYRTQEASYLALKLPYGWWMWGLDTETGQIDERQKNFFHQFCTMVRSRAGLPRPDRVVPPERLIVATCSPTTTFGKLADPEDFKSADAFGQLGIEQPFLPKRDVDQGANHHNPPDLSETGDARLRPGQCRLDLSGDVHHYARYWGPPPPPCSITPREGSGAKAERPTSDSYASVVSGIGGAFHHPSQTYYDEVREQSLYPSEQTSTDEVSRLVFKFWNIWNGGYVFLAGAIIAFLVYFAYTVPQSSRQVLNNLPHFGLGLATSERVNPTAVMLEEGPGGRGVVPANAGREKVSGLFGGEWVPPAPCAPGEPRYFFGPCRAGAPADFWAGLGMALVASLPLLLAAFRKQLYQEDPQQAGGKPSQTEQPPAGFGVDARPSREVETERGNEIKPAKRDPEIKGEPGPKLWALSALAFALFFLGLFMVKPYRAHITPFGNSLLVLLTFVWGGACVALTLRYTEFLFKKAHDKPVRQGDQALPWFLCVSAVLAVGLGLWSFGRNNPPALLASDMLFIGAMLLVFFGVIFVLPFSAATGLLAKRGAAGSVGKLLIGVWHYLLQVSVPFLLIRKASLLTLVIAAAVILIGAPVGERLLARFRGGALAAVWVVLGVLTLLLPVWLVPPAPPAGDGLWPALVRPWFAPGEWTGWLGLVPSLAAAVVGAVMCCYWFGWYLGVCFSFNGHNNEVGGAARIERFKQFVRFRLTSEGLTGYVIAVNDPTDNGRDLKPHVVDVFRLRPKA